MLNLFWIKVSNIGLDTVYHSLTHRTIRLANRLNFVTLVLFITLLIATRIIASFENVPFGMGTYRSIFIIIMCALIMVLSYRKQFKLSRFLLIYLSPFLLILLPTMVGFIEEESYVYYPYVLIIMSLYPQLLIVPDKEKVFYISSLAYYFICVVTIDLILIHFGEGQFQIIPIIQEFYAWYKIIPIVLFIFLSVSIYYLRSININFERDVRKKNKELDLQNETLKSTIQELNKTQAKLIHSEKMAALGNLTSGIAHEINNPLNYIAGGSFLLSEEIEDKEKDEPADKEQLIKASEMIESGMRRATRIVQLLSVFTENNGAEKIPHKVDDLVDGTLCFITVKTEGIIKITKEYELEENIAVYQDQIHKVLLAVFENAVEAIIETGEKGSIFIKSFLSQNKSEAVIEIWNSGISIPQKDLLRVFNPFFSTKNHKMNTGLGLTVAYNIIQEHAGDISIVNVNDGVLVRITLPLNQ